MNPKVFCKKSWPLLLACIALVLGLVSVYPCLIGGPGRKQAYHGLSTPALSQRFNQPSILTGRSDVVTVTPWLAPIVWNTSFDPVLLDALYEPLHITVAATVFAIGKYTQFLRGFLETAERHFFVGFRVRYYVFTDRPDEVPSPKMAAGRELFVRSVLGSKRWQEISAGRMKLVQDLIETELSSSHIDYMFCLDVDSKFHGRWGTETLGELVTVVHPWFYTTERWSFPYEREPASTAYMAADVGDFYYGGAVFGGELTSVRDLVSTCRLNYELDAQQGIEAAWQEESHLNRYLWIHKPTKVLSPEYLWHDLKAEEPEIRIIRFSGVIKNYAEIRPNV